MNNEGTNTSLASSLPEGEILALIQRALDGDAQAVAELYDLHYQKVYTFSYYRLNGDVALAEDVTEDTFLRAFRAIGSFRWRGTSFSAWLITIARNLIVDLSRLPETLPLEETWLDTSSDPAKITESEMSNAEVRRSLHKLTLEQKDVIILRFFDDMSIAETAESMGKTIHAVKRLQARALAALGNSLARPTD
ncbi:MAG: sigma-70 family RNA polymerase sigma factor [Chloroflexi bacterium]|nr:sigma-70 family RNA polymerase sigma factor [Chloroflexota bacterium]